MDFALLHKGVELAALAAAALNISLTGAPYPPQNTEIKEPALIESRNLPAENTVFHDLNSLTKNDEVNLKMVIKETEVFEDNLLVTVEQPPKIFTVSEPAPKPSVKPSAKPSALLLDDPKESPLPSNKPASSIKPETSKKSEIDEVKKDAKSPEPTPTPAPVGNLNSPSADRMWQMANEHRVKLGKSAFEKDERLCKIAEVRAPMVNSELSSGTLHKGFKDMKLPYWATENIAAYRTVEENFKFWIEDYIHRIAIEGDHKYSCVACAGSSCSQIFSSFVPK